ncbi:hypothetical protein [Neisseria elongata]|uniref:hypothetical protein n=1 Tax=Neisseria elongata TaxID=495 RepID=UPI00066504F1|nr:hypothetical protein [Neisseria elongata]
MSKLELTDFQILQLAATLAVSPDNSPKKAVKRMFECADLIRIELGDTELAEAKKAEQKRQREIMNNFQIGVTG